MSRDEYYTADSLRTLLETIPEACIVEFLREAGFFYLIWMAIYPEQLLIFKSATKWKDSEPELTPATPSDSVICLWSLSSYERTLPAKDG